MQLNKPIKKIWYAIDIIVIIFFLIILFLVFYLPGHSYTYYFKNNKPIENVLGLPVRLIIPKINIDVDIKYVGLDSSGAMDIPKDPDEVAWFELGPRPGDVGSAVVAGHYGFWKSGRGSIFDNLNQLRKGDKIYVKDEKGVIITFIVQELRRYDLNADASDIFISTDGKAHLNLITCEGNWDAVQKTYSDRLVIFTDKKTE
jgi:LPXTG-site transpeptidase (sortase) family protein